MKKMTEPFGETRAERFNQSLQFHGRYGPQVRATPANTGKNRNFRTWERRPSSIPKSRTKKLWFACCLFALLAHAFLTTETYMQYETTTETVIQMPTEMKPPATSVCFPIWNLVIEEKLRPGSKCQAELLINRTRIQACEQELLNNSIIHELIYNLTAEPVDFVIAFYIRRPSRNGTQWINRTIALRKNAASFRGDEVYIPGYVYSYYRGPYKCVRFQSQPLDSKTLGIDRMTTGYPRGMLLPDFALLQNSSNSYFRSRNCLCDVIFFHEFGTKARNFFIGYFKLDRYWTQAMGAVRLYVHENGSFPRGEVTLPVVANLSKALSFVITYTRIETHYLPAPYVHKCVDYVIDHSQSWFESRTHCVNACIRDKTIEEYNTIPSTHLLSKEALFHRDLKDRQSVFVSPNVGYVADYDVKCSQICQLGCVTKTFYTTLSETATDSLESNDTLIFDVSTRFENPETSVKFIPRLQFQEYIIYIAGVFGIWFSASIYHLSIDLVRSLRAAFKFIKLRHNTR